MKQTWEVSSQRCECGDLSRGSSVFGSEHSKGAPTLNPHQISEGELAENRKAGRGGRTFTCPRGTDSRDALARLLFSSYLPYVHKDAAINAKSHLIDHTGFNRHKDTAAVLSNYHPSSNKCQPCLWMSAIIVQDNEQYW